MVETFTFALNGKDFFLNGDLRLDVVVASEDVGSLDVDAQVGDIVGISLEVGQKHAPIKKKKWLVRLMCAKSATVPYQTSSSQSPKFDELRTILR